MKIFYHSAATPGFSGEEQEGVITLRCSQPSIIQPGEIKKVQTGITLKVEKGYALTVYTAPFLWDKAAEIFPAVLVIDHAAPETPLQLPIRNAGRSQLNLLVGQVLAFGIGVKTEVLEKEEFTPTNLSNSPAKVNLPQKRNTDVNFEIK